MPENKSGLPLLPHVNQFFYPRGRYQICPGVRGSIKGSPEASYTEQRFLTTYAGIVRTDLLSKTALALGILVRNTAQGASQILKIGYLTRLMPMRLNV